MSDIKIHDYAQRARRSTAVRAQAAALPPQPERHDGDHWDLNRRGFAHAFYPGMAGLRTGSLDPVVAAAREAALDAGVDPTLVDDIDIEDLIVTPEFISGTVGGITFRTRLGQPLSPPEQVPSNLVPSGVSEPLILTSTSGASSSSAVLPGPCIARNVSWSSVGFSATQASLRLTGTNWSLMLTSNGTPLYSSDGNLHELGVYVPEGRSVQFILDTVGVTTAGPFTAIAAIEALIKKQ